MKDEYKVISKFVKEELKSRKLLYNVSPEDFVNSCYDEYLLLKENGLSEAEALLKAKESLLDSLDSNDSALSRKNKYKYSYLVALSFLAISFVMVICGVLISDIIDVYGVIYPILLLLSVVLLIYTIITHKSRCMLDYVIVIILFLSVLTINTQVFIYFFRARTFDYYYTANYNFPGLISFNRYWIISKNPIKYDIDKVVYLFDPCLITSLTSYISTLVFRLKAKCENKN